MRRKLRWKWLQVLQVNEAVSEMLKGVIDFQLVDF